MNYQHLTRRIIQFVIGLVVMALGIVLMKRVDLGISPITCIPASVSNFTPLTIGNLTIILHVVCVIGQIITERHFSFKNVLTMLVGFLFGYIIDGLMLLIHLDGLSLPLRFVTLVLGLACSGFGLLLTVSTDVALPAPDGLSHTISQVYSKKLSNVKVISDAVYVSISIILDLIFTGRISSAGIGTVLSVLLVGRFVGWFGKLLPKLKMDPLWPAVKTRN